MTQAQTHWRFAVPDGEICIAPFNGRWIVRWQSQDLGSYFSAEEALKRLIGHQVLAPIGSSIDIRTLDFPTHLDGWERIEPSPSTPAIRAVA